MSVLIRYRRAIAAVLAAMLGLLTMTLPPDLVDFAAAGDLLLQGRLGEVYASAWNQAGPAQLLISRLLMIGAAPDGTPWPPIVALWDAAFVAGAMWLCARLSRPVADVRREAVAGLLALLWVCAPMPWNGHPAEILTPVLWAYAIVLQRRGRDLAAAGLLALGIALAPWGILAVPCLLAAARPARAVRTGVIAVAGGVACYVPFALTGHFAMFRITWTVGGRTLASLLGITEFTWWLRPVQAAVVALGVAAIAWRLRRSESAFAAVPLAAGLLRVGTDPVEHPYYWYPVAVASLLLLATARRWVLAAAIAYAALLAESANWPAVGAAACLALLAFGRKAPGEQAERGAGRYSPAVFQQQVG
ncbi:hypothetical protein ACIA5D_48285 [Actinoplanes sp. NPDC051513]|uniref:hypothetical protein n=1 Tax=Actinoplanes sp. NPDC051513 TaxID=3363908 RepID=UPI0037AFF826